MLWRKPKQKRGMGRVRAQCRGGEAGGHVLFKLSGRRGFAMKVIIELRVKCGEVSPEDLWHNRRDNGTCEATAHSNLEPRQ